jgi:hypothetical protein
MVNIEEATPALVQVELDLAEYLEMTEDRAEQSYVETTEGQVENSKSKEQGVAVSWAAQPAVDN